MRPSPRLVLSMNTDQPPPYAVNRSLRPPMPWLAVIWPSAPFSKWMLATTLPSWVSSCISPWATTSDARPHMKWSGLTTWMRISAKYAGPGRT